MNNIKKIMNEKSQLYFFKLITILIVSVFFVSACATDKRERELENKSTTLTFEKNIPSEIIKNGDYSKTSTVTVLSEDKKYRVTLYSNTFPIPLQKIHSWSAHIEYANGKPLEKAKIYIHGGMPVHRHGFPVTPRVQKNLGDGNFLIEGVKFSMIGNWEIRLNIKEETQRDRAVFEIKIAP